LLSFADRCTSKTEAMICSREPSSETDLDFDQRWTS